MDQTSVSAANTIVPLTKINVDLSTYDILINKYIF